LGLSENSIISGRTQAQHSSGRKLPRASSLSVWAAPPPRPRHPRCRGSASARRDSSSQAPRAPAPCSPLSRQTAGRHPPAAAMIPSPRSHGPIARPRSRNLGSYLGKRAAPRSFVAGCLPLYLGLGLGIWGSVLPASVRRGEWTDRSFDDFDRCRVPGGGILECACPSLIGRGSGPKATLDRDTAAPGGQDGIGARREEWPDTEQRPAQAHLSATSQQYFSLRTNQPPSNSQ
jgi:hypothetical protein